jgi:hypothetical protein
MEVAERTMREKGLAMSTETTPRIVPPSSRTPRDLDGGNHLDSGPDRIIPPPSRTLRDGRGRIIATDAEWAERMARLAEVFARYEAGSVDEPPGLDEEIMRGIDEGRPHRPLFDGMY